MQKSVEPGVSFIGRAVRIGLLWAAWVYAGTIAFGPPHLIRGEADPVTALAGAPQEVKIYVGIWLLGSIMFCALLMITLRQAFGAKKASKPDS